MTTITTATDHARHVGRGQRERQPSDSPTLPVLLTVDEAADFLRTTRRAIYVMIARRQLPGVVRIRRRVLVRADDLLHWLDQKRASSPKEQKAMSVTVRPYRRGGWEEHITIRLPNGRGGETGAKRRSRRRPRPCDGARAVSGMSCTTAPRNQRRRCPHSNNSLRDSSTD